jgi:hypothetical protein
MLLIPLPQQTTVRRQAVAAGRQHIIVIVCDSAYDALNARRAYRAGFAVRVSRRSAVNVPTQMVV